MPELPEVEVMRNYFEHAAFDKVVRRVHCYDPKILKGEIRGFNSSLKGGVFQRTLRRGKYLFALTQSRSLVFHFGMTGDLELCSASDDLPRFSRLSFEFNNGEFLHVTSLRKFGYVQEIDDVETFIEVKKLGPDALKISLNDLLKMLDGPKTKLKPFLMDQKRIAGIGNWIADELLHRCMLHPERTINTLSDGQKKSLHKELGKILKAAIRRKTNKGNFPSKWFVNQRVAGGTCTRCGIEVDKKQVGGRSTYFCNECQET